MYTFQKKTRAKFEEIMKVTILPGHFFQINFFSNGRGKESSSPPPRTEPNRTFFSIKSQMEEQEQTEITQ